MPALFSPPRATDADRDYVVVVTRLRVRSLRTAVRFLRALGPVRAQMAAADAMLGWGLEARLLSMNFATYAVFDSRRAMADFVGSGAHGAIMGQLRGRLAHAEAVTVSRAGRDLPRGWAEIHAVIDEHAARRAEHSVEATAPPA